jgi:hypothetical protein
MIAWPGYTFKPGACRQAVAEARRAVEVSNRGIMELMYLGHALDVSGSAEANGVLHQMMDLSTQRYVPPEYIAVVYAGMGDKDNAFQWTPPSASVRCSPGSTPTPASIRSVPIPASKRSPAEWGCQNNPAPQHQAHRLAREPSLTCTLLWFQIQVVNEVSWPNSGNPRRVLRRETSTESPIHVTVNWLAGVRK